MRKRPCLLLILPFFLGGCQTPEVNPTTSSVVSQWPETVQEVVGAVLGEYDIPYFEANEYVAEVRSLAGVPVAVINCAVDFRGTDAELIYSLTLQEEGYEISDMRETDGCYLGSKVVVENELAIIIQYSYLTSAFNDFLAIVTYLYQNPQLATVSETWPSDEIAEICGEDIPSFSASRYEIQYDVTPQGNQTIDLYCYEPDLDAETIYGSALTEAGYTITEYSGLFYALHEVKQIEIVYYLAYEEYFFIRAYSLG